MDTESRATGVLARILALSEDEVRETLHDVRARFGDRHRDLPGVLAAHAGQIAHRVPAGVQLSTDQQALLGAWFTLEYSLEGAALFNPSIVAHPDQTGLAPEQCRILMSLRAVGEGHLSSIEFRTGVIGPGATVRLDEQGRHVEAGTVGPTPYDLGLFRTTLADAGADEESARFLLGRLPDPFTRDELELALTALTGQAVTRHGGEVTAQLARRIAQCSYQVAIRLVSMYINTTASHTVEAVVPTSRSVAPLRKPASGIRSEPFCLQRSWVTSLLLRRHGIPSQVVIGYRPVPLDSHAWVEVAGRVVNDRPQYQKFYQVPDRL